jgi:hypothetical protein
MQVSRYSLLAISFLCQSCAAHTDSRTVASSTSSRAETVAESATLTVNAEMLGQLLFERYEQRGAAASARDRNAVSIVNASINDGCGWTREVVLIPSSQVPFPTQQIHLKDRSGLLAYAIGSVSDSQAVVLGAHYRFELEPDGTAVRSVVQSMPGCASRPRSELSGASIDVRPAKAPSEFDVFLSLLHKATFRLRTTMGVWEVDNGALNLVTADPTYQPDTNGLIDCRLPDGAKITTTAVACQGSGGTILD